MGDYVYVNVVAHETQKRMPCLWLEIQTAVIMGPGNRTQFLCSELQDSNGGNDSTHTHNT